MRIVASVDDDGSAARIRVAVLGPTGEVSLGEDDELRLEAAGESVGLVLVDGDRPAYTAVSGSGVGDYTLSLERTDDASLLGLLIGVPPPFTLSASGTMAEPLQLGWDAGEGSYTTVVEVSGDCIRPLFRELSVDTGAYSIATAELSNLPGQLGVMCALEVSLTRRVTGESGPLSATATQKRTLVVDWTG